MKALPAPQAVAPWGHPTGHVGHRAGARLARPTTSTVAQDTLAQARDTVALLGRIAQSDRMTAQATVAQSLSAIASYDSPRAAQEQAHAFLYEARQIARAAAPGSDTCEAALAAYEAAARFLGVDRGTAYGIVHPMSVGEA